MPGKGHFDVGSPSQLGDNKVIKGGFLLGEEGKELRMINFTGESNDAEGMTVFFATQITELQTNAGDEPSGPGVGIIEFASGGALQARIEFDLPVPHQFGPNFATDPPAAMPRVQSASGVLAINIAGASVISAARMDSALKLVGDPTKPIGALNVVPTPATPQADLKVAMRVSSWLSRFPYGSPQHQKLKRTVYITKGGAAAFPFATVVAIGIPNLSRRVRFFRDPLATTPLEINVGGINSRNTLITVPAGSIGPIELQQDAYIMTVRNAAAATNIDALSCEFELEI